MFEFEGYTNFTMCTRHKLNQEIMKAYDDVYSNWLAGEYDAREPLNECMLYDKKARDLTDLHYCLWQVFPKDRLYRDYWCPSPKDWLSKQGMTEWPTRVTREFQGARTFLTPVVCPIPGALPVDTVPDRHNPRYWVPILAQIRAQSIPVLEPMRQTKRRKVDLEELSPSEEFDLEPVALPVEPVVRRSKRVKYARDFYYGY